MSYRGPYTSFIVSPPMAPYINVVGKTVSEVSSSRVDVTSDVSHYMDPGTPAEELAEIYYLPNKMAEGRNISHSPSDIAQMEARITRTMGFPFELIRRAIAGNPNAPVALLFDAALLYPEEVAKNPVLPFLLIEDPRLRQFPTRAIKQILQYADASISNALIVILNQRAPGIRGTHCDVFTLDEATPLSQEDWKRLLQEEY